VKYKRKSRRRSFLLHRYLRNFGGGFEHSKPPPPLGTPLVVNTTSRPGKTWCPLYRRLGGPQGRSGRVRKISPPPGLDPRTVQPVASRYTKISWFTVIQKFKIENVWEGKRSHRCEVGNTVVSGTFPFHFAFKETSGRPEFSLRRRCEKRSHHEVACAGGGVLWHQN